MRNPKSTGQSVRNVLQAWQFLTQNPFYLHYKYVRNVIQAIEASTNNLQGLIGSNNGATRDIGILALRDILSSSDSSYDKFLRPTIVEMLSSILQDSNLDNRRSAMNTFNAAARNKASMILPHLTQLLPLVFKQTLEDPSLIREVSMGPFKHKVDDGLEVRKVRSHASADTL